MSTLAAMVALSSCRSSIGELSPPGKTRAMNTAKDTTIVSRAKVVRSDDLAVEFGDGDSSGSSSP